MNRNQKTIGVFALQGAFLEHQQKLESMGHRALLIRDLKDAKSQKWDGVILPGGESTTMKKLLKKTGLDKWLLDQGEGGTPVFGTCAGLIVLTDMGLLDIKVRRNAYGSQLDSFEDTINLDVKCHMSNVTCIFIRAPKITKIGKGITTLGRHKKTPVLVKQENIMAASFHPELTEDKRIYEIFLDK